jgi:hypothetical protein
MISHSQSMVVHQTRMGGPFATGGFGVEDMSPTYLVVKDFLNFGAGHMSECECECGCAGQR